jgi:hypothetical protein
VMFAMEEPFRKAIRFWMRPFSANMTKRRIHRGVGRPPDATTTGSNKNAEMLTAR